MEVFGEVEGLLNSLTFGGGGAAIKGVQRGQSEMTSTSLDVTISAVDLSKACVLVRLVAPTSNTATEVSQVLASVQLLNSTTLRFTRGSGGSSTRLGVSWQVIEFAAGASVQQVIVSLASVTSTTVTITTVDTSKTFLFLSQHSGPISGTSISSVIGYSMWADFVDGSTLRVSRGLSTGTHVAIVFVVEVK